MEDTPNKYDDAKFNETIKRMLKTPPKPHDSDKGEVSHTEKAKPPKASPSSSSKQ